MEILVTILNNKEITHFSDRFFTVNTRHYEIIQTEKRGRTFFHTVKNDSGEYKEFSHDKLVQFIKSGDLTL